jgi:SWI/SNF-related matrix-associated actin-dependent regulator 1 of chromatin subfamily A
MVEQLESIRRAIKATSEDEFERLKYSEKQLVNKIYTDSAVAKLPAVQDYLTTLLEVCTSLESVCCTPNCKHGK